MHIRTTTTDTVQPPQCQSVIVRAGWQLGEKKRGGRRNDCLPCCLPRNLLIDWTIENGKQRFKDLSLSLSPTSSVLFRLYGTYTYSLYFLRQGWDCGIQMLKNNDEMEGFQRSGKRNKNVAINFASPESYNLPFSIRSCASWSPCSLTSGFAISPLVFQTFPPSTPFTICSLKLHQATNSSFLISPFRFFLLHPLPEFFFIACLHLPSIIRCNSLPIIRYIQKKNRRD